MTKQRSPFFFPALLLLALLLLTPATPAKAHPHVYIDATLTFKVDESGLKALHQHWLFDEIFSSAIMADLELTPETLGTTLGQEKLRNGAFAYLANYDYFTFVETGGKRVPITETTGFKATVSEGRLIYDFTVPLNLPFDQLKDCRVAVFDKEYYSDILLMKDAIGFEVDGMVQVSHVVRPAKDQTYWQFIVPEAIHLSLSNTPGSDTDLPLAAMEEAEAPSLMERVMGMVRDIQKQLTLKLNGFGMDIRGNPFGSALWMFLGLSFLYGVVHAVGPGHGKSVVCSYFLSNPGSLFTGAVMGNAITFVHMGSAAVAVGIAYLVFSSGMGGFAEASRALQPASYALLALMGLFLFGKTIRDLIKGGLIPAACEHGESLEEDQNMRRVLTVSFVTGLVPCPGAAVILAFAIGQDIFWAGMLALFAMAVGMGVTTTLFAWAAVAARNVTLKLSGKNRSLFNWVYGALSLCGAAAIALFGAALFMSSNVWH
ncbi:DUF1007 family protein [Pseudodesulfovibrio sp. zrk46]|uniref:HoxN/HupN/NixA family nickel/cobalt transporter n=1 Tax=Pseudodesulfovibrio sp. zrk46 TaxID=2725288 RepID=UPI001449E0E4|nr:DUF1007 family protein [Pseudodesulfovibrio sp. zrk46]QJB56218.1 DUF1007 family protein [Pseudodesulfovibrio sp. zrk46]